MSLVAYDGSTDEENGDNEEQEDGGGKVILLPKTQTGQTLLNGVSSHTVKFSKLPQPLDSGTIEEVQDEFLKKKEQPTEKPSKQPVKITLPSMSQFDSDDEDAAATKVAPKAAKASGLFALLPAPKGTPLSNKSFIPQVLTKKPKPQPKKKPQPKPVRPTTNEDSGESDVDMEDMPETFDEETWKKVCAPNKKPQKRTIDESQQHVNGGTSTAIQIAPEAPKPYNGLDNEAFKQLVGSSKRRRENIKLIDINEEEVTADKDLWITKSLTDPDMVPKQQEEEEEDTINNTQRRKHHITYLAQQVFSSLFCCCCCFSLTCVLFCFSGQGERTGTSVAVGKQQVQEVTHTVQIWLLIDFIFILLLAIVKKNMLHVLFKLYKSIYSIFICNLSYIIFEIYF